MVRKKNKATPLAPHDAFTPTRRSARINNAGPVAGTPGERFRNVSAACSDFVAFAEIVTNVDQPLDDVVLSPPPTKRSKNVDLQFVTNATINVADFPLLSDDHVDDGGCGYDNRKMPAQRDDRTTSTSRTTVEDDDGCGDDNQKMPARHDETSRQTSTAEDDGDTDAFLSSCEYDNVDKGGEYDDGDKEEGDEDHNNEGREDEDGDEVEGEDEESDEVEDVDGDDEGDNDEHNGTEEVIV